MMSIQSNAVQPSHRRTPVSRQHIQETTVTQRTEAYLKNIKSILADGNWHYISQSEIAKVHNVDTSLIRFLYKMGAVERKQKGHYHEYRRCQALAMLTTETLLSRARELRREEQKASDERNRQRNEQAAKAPADSLFPPAEPATDTGEQTAATDAINDIPEEAEPATYILQQTANGLTKLHSLLFNSQQECYDYIEENAGPGETWDILQFVDTVSTKIQITRSAK